jgi:SpoVK/Ycf46/Vps4 family AAA+-type ATPase
VARADLVKKMLLSYQRGDDTSFRRAAEQVVAEERKKRHDSLADELEGILTDRREARPLNVSSLRPLPTTRDDSALLQLTEPRIRLEDVVLNRDLRSELSDILAEFRQRELLAAHSLPPRSRLLFVGEPGCGKSVTAEALASALGLPVARMQLATVVSSFLGETSRHLQQILEFCRHGSWVLILDELDTLAKERADRSEHGELRRVVATFLQLLEDFRTDTLVIATSNHPALLDAAVWRRFDALLVFERPSREQIVELLHLKLRRMKTQFNTGVIAETLSGATHADVEAVCFDAARSAVLEGTEVITAREMERAAARLAKRRHEVDRFQTLA